MKRFLNNVVVLALFASVLSACAGQKEEPLYYEDGIVNLHGPWENQEGPATAEDEEAFEAIRENMEAKVQLASK